MLVSEFASKLQKLNQNLWIDFNHKTIPEHVDFPATGLFCNGKFVMGVPLGNILRESVWGVNIPKLELENEKGLPGLGDWLDNHWVEYHQKFNADKIDDRIVARGYGFILSELVRAGYINLSNTERLFNLYLNPNYPEHLYPRRYLGLSFEGE